MPQTSILITGCSSGIGYCTAIMLKQRGYRVFASARREADLEPLKAQGIETVQLDVNDSDSMQRALDYILSLTGGTLDALFNNAGFLQTGAIEDLNRDMMRAQFETNVFGLMELTQRVLPIMRKQGHGRIIQNSSILGVITIPLCGAYTASKHALEGFSGTLRQELRGTNIHVALINPGPITSKLRDNAYQKHQTSIKPHASPHHEAMYQRLEQTYFKPSKADKWMAKGPEAVVKKIIHALESKHPNAHYFIGMPAQILAFLRRILPDCVMDWMLSKAR